MNKIENYNFKGKKVLIRVDFNVPLDKNFNVTDNTRIVKAIPTLNKVLNDGGSVILMSHLGRPKGGYEEAYSLRHIVSEISELMKRPVKFAQDCVDNEALSMSGSLQVGEVLLLENLRFHKHETAGTEDFAKTLSKHADFYINDAFGTAHRAHASTTIVAKFFPGKKCFGYLMENEISHIDMFLKEGKRPLTAIMGGAKVSSKIDVLENLLDKIDNLIIGGGMIFSFIKCNGGKTGSSLVEDDKLTVARSILDKAKALGVNVYLPQDSVVADRFENSANRKIEPSDNISDGYMGLDIGPAAIEQFNNVILSSKTILWNGPMGVFEMSNFSNGTQKIAESIAKSTENGSYSLIGGGDSVAAINQFNMADRVSYVSTGGGALMEYLEGKILPGIQAIND